jgi:hypothetical protein
MEVAEERRKALNPVLQGLPMTAAGALGPLLTSTDPGAFQLGVRQLEEYQRRKSPEVQLGMALNAQQFATSQTQQARYQQEIEQAAQMGPLNVAATKSLIAQRQAAAQASLSNAELARTGKINQTEGRLNDTFLKQMQAPSEVADAVMQIDNALKTEDSLGALAAVVKLAKVLDPTSVVREGEVTTVQGGTGTAENLIATYNKTFGQGFSKAGADRFRTVTRAVAAPVLQRGLRIQSELNRSAELLGVRPAQVGVGLGWVPEWVQGYLQGMADPAAQADVTL